MAPKAYTLEDVQREQLEVGRKMLAALKGMLAPYGGLPLEFFREGDARDGIKAARAAIAAAEEAGIKEE
jgi:hypothetical protein